MPPAGARRWTALLAIALAAGSISLAGCAAGSGVGSGTTGPGAVVRAGSSHRGAAKSHADPAVVVTAMHYVQLFASTDPLLRDLQGAIATHAALPVASRIGEAADALQQFSTEAPNLPGPRAGADVRERLAAASAALAARLAAIAGGARSPAVESGFDGALARFQAAAALARQAVGLPTSG